MSATIDKRLIRWFPPMLIRAEKVKLPKTLAEVPAGKDLALTVYDADGVVLRNRYDPAAALYPRSQRYFEKAAALLDEMGALQVIWLTPLHPLLLVEMREAGRSERHAEVIAYLRRVQERRDFRLLDCSELSSIAGDPDDFYGGFHFKRANARRLIRAIVGAFPEAFGGETAPITEGQ
jgi:hypothetical protein